MSESDQGAQLGLDDPRGAGVEEAQQYPHLGHGDVRQQQQGALVPHPVPGLQEQRLEQQRLEEGADPGQDERVI